jgi:hypothetical protein
MVHYVVSKWWVAVHRQKEEFEPNMCQVGQLKTVYEVNCVNYNVMGYRRFKEWEAIPGQGEEF